jgi:hypothetical protein
LGRNFNDLCMNTVMTTNHDIYSGVEGFPSIRILRILFQFRLVPTYQEDLVIFELQSALQGFHVPKRLFEPGAGPQTWQWERERFRLPFSGGGQVGERQGGQWVAGGWFEKLELRPTLRFSLSLINLDTKMDIQSIIITRFLTFY